MQHNTAMGERGLKVWAKKVSQTALKQGRDKFTSSTSSRVAERMLLNTITDRLLFQAEQDGVQHTPPDAGVKRRVPHFRYERLNGSNSLQSLDRKGNVQVPNGETGVIQGQILEGIYDVEAGRNQTFFDIWCEARLPNGQYIRCWPQYRRSEGTRYDWAMTSFESENDDDEEGESQIYPAKVLALYEDSEGTLKALVHSVEYKTERGVEGPFGDSRLVRHYRLQFHPGSGKPKMYSVPIDHIQDVIVAYEAIRYSNPLVPQVRSLPRRREHTVMAILPRSQWATLFLEWTRELKERHETLRGRDRYRLDW